MIPSWSDSPIAYPARVPLAILPSPLDPMARFSESLGGADLWVKRDDLTGLELTGNKARKLEFLVADAQAQGCDTLGTYGGPQSNHCRAAAAVGARLGMKVHIIIRGNKPEGAPDGNLLLNFMLGAEVTYAAPDTFLQNKQKIIDGVMESQRARGRRPYYFPVGGSVPVGVWAYVRCLEEIRAQAAERGLKVRHVVCACGSGGTVAGLILGRALLGWKDVTIHAMAVTMTEAFWQSDLRTLLRDTCKKYSLSVADDDLPVHVSAAYVGEGYAIPYADELAVIRQVARTEGLLLDPVYTGKAMMGLVDYLKKGRIGRGETTVFVHTGGVFGLFAQRDVLLES